MDEMTKKGSAARGKRATGKGQERMTTALAQITEAVGNSRNLQELFQAIHGIVASLMPVKNFYIAFSEKDEKSQELVTFPYFQDEVDTVTTGRVPLKKTFTGYVIRTGRPLLADHKMGRRLIDSGEVEEFLGTESAIWLGVPLKVNDQTIGAMVVQSYDRRDEYGENEKQILSFISSQIAIAVELMRYREKLEELVRQRTKELLEEEKVFEALFEISQSVYTSSGLGDFLVTVQKKIGQLMDARNFYVALYDPLVGKYHFPFYVDEFDRADPDFLEDLDHTLTDYVRKKGPLLADRAVHERLIREGEVAGVTGTDSLIWLGVPLHVPGKSEAIGVMTLQSYKNSHCYSEKEKKILMQVSTTVALAIDRISLVSDLFHHFSNAVTGIRGNAEILLRANKMKAEWLERLEQYVRSCARDGQEGNGPIAAAELERIIQLLSEARENSESHLGRIIEGIEDAAKRMNTLFTPLLHRNPVTPPETKR